MCNKKLILALTVFIMVISMSACGKNNEPATKHVDTETDETLENEVESNDNTITVQETTLYERVGGKLYVGDEFTLGTYEQDNNLDNGAEDIEWIVYEYSANTDSYLCVSKYVLDSAIFNSASYQEDNPSFVDRGWSKSSNMVYDPFSTFWQNTGLESYNDSIAYKIRNGEDVDTYTIYNYFVTSNWETSEIRKWLNNNFYNTAFSEIEKQYICNTQSRYLSYDDVLDCAFGSRKTFNTNDYVSMLNADKEYSNINMRCQATPYAISQGVDIINDGTRENENMCVEYWLLDATDYSATEQRLYRVVSAKSFSNGESGYSHSYAYESRGVRPVISIKLSEN